MYMPEDREVALSMGKTNMPACFTALESLAVPEKISRNIKSERTLSVNRLLDVELDEGDGRNRSQLLVVPAWHGQPAAQLVSFSRK